MAAHPSGRVGRAGARVRRKEDEYPDRGTRGGPRAEIQMDASMLGHRKCSVTDRPPAILPQSRETTRCRRLQFCCLPVRAGWAVRPLRNETADDVTRADITTTRHTTYHLLGTDGNHPTNMQQRIVGASHQKGPCVRLSRPRPAPACPGPSSEERKKKPESLARARLEEAAGCRSLPGPRSS